MSVEEPKATHSHEAGELDETLLFLKRTRSELSELRRVQVSTNWVKVFDVNGDFFLIEGIGYPDGEILPVLDAVNTVYRPESIHQPFGKPYKEFKTGRRRPWAEDRVM